MNESDQPRGNEKQKKRGMSLFWRLSGSRPDARDCDKC